MPDSTEAQQAEEQVLQLMREGKLREAAAACDDLTQRFPGYDSGWYTASQLAMTLNEPEVGLRAIDQALRVSPGKPEWLLQKTAFLSVVGEDAVATAVAAELSKHDFPTAYHSATCGLTLNRLGLYDDAERHFRRAIELEPDNHNHHYNLATMLRFLGKPDEALSCLDRALELNAEDYNAHLLRSGLKTQTPADNHIEILRAALQGAPENDPGRVQLCYALAKELEDIGDYESSFENLNMGTKTLRGAMQYRAERDLATMRKLREEYTADLFDGSIEGFINAEPVFIIGAPGTGTTLIDRILGGHSVVKPLGEIQAFGVELVNQCKFKSETIPTEPSELVPLTRQIDFSALGEAYIASARPKVDPTAHFVDSLPVNFLYAGLIHLALPKAKIIWLDRDPPDTCYAVYKTLFEGANPYSYDLQELATYHVEYHKLMRHWVDLLPEFIYRVSYEDLVTEPRPAIESLLSHCGLSWEEQCLNVQDSGHADSVGKWRHYEKQLQPALEILRQADLIQ